MLAHHPCLVDKTSVMIAANTPDRINPTRPNTISFTGWNSRRVTYSSISSISAAIALSTCRVRSSMRASSVWSSSFVMLCTQVRRSAEINHRTANKSKPEVDQDQHADNHDDALSDLREWLRQA